MSEFPKLLEAISDSMETGVFIIGRVTPPRRGREALGPEDFRQQFCGDTSAAHALIALGIIAQNTADGGQSIIIHNRETIINFPQNYG